jgi:hypothetical protein
MVWDASIAKTSKQCHSCQKEFAAEEMYFSSLATINPATCPTGTKMSGKGQEESEHFERRDFCTACWEQAGAKQPDLFSFWQMKVVVKEPPKTPKDILINFFDNLIEPPSSRQNDGITGQAPATTIDTALRPKVIYLFALILIRKRILKLKQSAVRENPFPSGILRVNGNTQDKQRLLILERNLDGSNTNVKTYEVPDIDIPENELVSLRDEFSRLFEFKI